jgi:hypothetical protein
MQNNQHKNRRIHMCKTRMYLMLLLSLMLLLTYGVRRALTQTSSGGKFPEAAQQFAGRILRSPGAKYLSGSTLSALELISKNASSPEQEAEPSRGRVAAVLSAPLSPSEVQVNDPSKDLFFADITTQSETAVAGVFNHVVVTYNDSTSPGFIRGSGSALGHALSVDGGNRFVDLGPMPMGSNFLGLGDPSLVAASTGEFYSAELALVPPFNQGSIVISKSIDAGKTFQVSFYFPFGEIPGFADKDFLTVNNVSDNGRGNLYLSWTDVFSGSILFSRSTNRGVTFSEPIVLAPPDGLSFYSGSEPAVGPNGDVYVTWLKFAVGVYIARSTDRGQTFGPPTPVAFFNGIGSFAGNLRGNFRVNSFPRIDVNPVNGEVYIVFSANPSPFGPDSSDVYFTRSRDHGNSWSDPIRVNDDVTSNDQFFPDVAVGRTGIVQVMWYDRRLDPENLNIDVFRARSTDGGVSFEPNQRVTSVSAFPAVGYDPVLFPTYMGDYLDIKAATKFDGTATQFLLAWGDFRRIISTPGGIRGDQDVLFSKLE